MINGKERANSAHLILPTSEVLSPSNTRA